MAQTIADWAGYIAAVALLVAWTAWTVEAIALGNAGWAAVASPFAVVGWLIVPFWVATQVGWITPS